MNDVYRFLISCHGNIIFSEKLIEIPENVKIITFAQPGQTSDESKECLFNYYSIVFGNSFVVEFSKALYYFNLKLYEMANYFYNKTSKPINYDIFINELRENYKFYKEILKVILKAGIDQCSGFQSICMYGKGSQLSDKISNYSLSKRKNEYGCATIIDDECKYFSQHRQKIMDYPKEIITLNVLDKDFPNKSAEIIKKEYSKLETKGPDFKNFEITYKIFKIDDKITQDQENPIFKSNISYEPINDYSYNIFIKDEKYIFYSKSYGSFYFNPNYNGYKTSKLNSLYYSYKSGKYGCKIVKNDFSEIIEEEDVESPEKNSDIIENINISIKIKLETSGLQLKKLLNYLETFKDMKFVLFINICKVYEDSRICEEANKIEELYVSKFLNKYIEKENDEYENTRFFFKN